MRRRRVLDLELDAPGLAHDAKVEVAILSKIVRESSISLPEVEHGERRTSEQGIQRPDRNPAVWRFLLRQCSKLPFGPPAASTMSDERIEASTQHLLGENTQTGSQG